MSSAKCRPFCLGPNVLNIYSKVPVETDIFVCFIIAHLAVSGIYMVWFG